MKKIISIFSAFILLMNFSCENSNEKNIEVFEDLDTSAFTDTLTGALNYNKEIKILSLGDSYTIGESVCKKCRFPEQLKDSLLKKFEKDTVFSLQIIANTGWTTTNLIDAIARKDIPNNFDLVTLLIGVNNQYMGKRFSIYENEFPKLISIAIEAANSNKNRLIVVSIPDYAFTPNGAGNRTISQEIDTYNTFAREYCNKNGISFVNITDITRNGLVNNRLIASDNLHPSAIAYTQFVKRILPFASIKLKN